MTITEFLLAQIAEDEAEVGPLLPGGCDEGAGPNGVGWAEVGGISEVLLVRQSRVLAECEAKRWIVGMARAVDGEPNPPEALRLADDTLHALASV